MNLSRCIEAALQFARKGAEFVGVLFEDYKLARRLMFFWALAMVTDAWLYFKGMSVVSDNQRLILLAVFGMLSLMIGFYQWSRDREV